jgi:hypothetical protein
MNESSITNGLHILDAAHSIVDTAGGYFIGVQTHIASDQASLWFTNPATKRELSVVFNPLRYSITMLTEQVRTKIALDNEEQAKRFVRIPVRVLKQLSDKLLKLSQEIQALYEEKR